MNHLENWRNREARRLRLKIDLGERCVRLGSRIIPWEDIDPESGAGRMIRLQLIIAELNGGVPESRKETRIRLSKLGEIVKAARTGRD